MFIIILKDISVFLLNNKLKREYKIMLIKIRGGNMKRDFYEKNRLGNKSIFYDLRSYIGSN